MAIISNKPRFYYIGFLAHEEMAEKVEMAEMAEYIARGEILDEGGEAWLQEIQLGECEDENQAAALVAGLIERGDLEAWLWVSLYRLEQVRVFWGN